MREKDSEIQQAVLRELKWDTRVDETDIGVIVDEGVVSLTGTVSSWGKRMAAQEAAHRVTSVLDVTNNVKVKTPGTLRRNDTEIAGAVRHALEWNVFVPEKRIRSTVSKGWVTLEGEVETWSQKEDAKRAIRNLASVRGITDHINVKTPMVLPSKVRKSIEEALERQAERAADQIELRVRDGEVTVSGIVHSWAEREAVIGAATGTSGVRGVKSDLIIQP